MSNSKSISNAKVLLARGRDHLAIPGPSVMPERVLRAMHRPAPNIYEGELVDLTYSIKSDLNTLASNSGEVALYIGNGHAAWEASLTNVFSRGDKALFLVNGRFGMAWAQVAEALGIDVQILDFGHKEAVDSSALGALLANDKSHAIKAVLAVHTDTASSSSNNLESIRDVLQTSNHPALFLVDSIASFACERFYMDEFGVDVMITASQKGLMTPPGLAMMFVSDRFWAAQKNADLVTPYWNAHSRIYPSMFPDNYSGTPPTHHLYALREALDILLEEGIENTWRRHEVMAEAVWAAVDAWGESYGFSCNVPSVSMRSRAVTMIQTPAGVGRQLQQLCIERFGVVLGVALDPNPSGVILDDAFRIGHMGHLNPPMLLGTLGTIEAGLDVLNVRRGTGAVEAAAKVMANAST